MDPLPDRLRKSGVNPAEEVIAETGARATGWRLSWRRFALWFNPTLIQQALWPVIAIVSGHTLAEEARSDWFDWAGEMLCLLLALVLVLRTMHAYRYPFAAPPVGGHLAANARILIVGLSISVCAARLIAGSPVATARFVAAGLLIAVTSQLIHFGIALPTFQRTMTVIILFGISWTIRQSAWTLATDSGDPLLFSALGGLTIGLGLGALSALFRRWPGGLYCAIGLQWLLMTLIFGYAQ
jgi:hypothetical protein